MWGDRSSFLKREMMGEDLQLLEESLHLGVFCREKAQVHFPAEEVGGSSPEPRFCLGRDGKLKCFQIEIQVMRCDLKDWDGTPRISRHNPLHQLIQLLPEGPRDWSLVGGAREEVFTLTPEPFRFPFTIFCSKRLPLFCCSNSQQAPSASWGPRLC